MTKPQVRGLDSDIMFLKIRVRGFWVVKNETDQSLRNKHFTSSINRVTVLRYYTRKIIYCSFSQLPTT